MIWFVMFKHLVEVAFVAVTMAVLAVVGFSILGAFLPDRRRKKQNPNIFILE